MVSLQHFYLEDQEISAEAGAEFVLRLAADDARHLHVLRMGPGEHVAVVDAAQDYFECEIAGFDGDLPRVRIARHLDARQGRPHVVLVQGLAKGDKVDEVVRHATELGVAAFIPLKCARSVLKLDEKRAAKKVERWRAIAKSAAMQSGQPAIPEVLAPMTPREAAAALSGATALCVCWEEAAGSLGMGAAIRAGLEHYLVSAADARVAIVVGPEGGLTCEEVDAFLGAVPTARLVSLGPSILRTETAGVVAPALALYELGCLGGK